MLKLTDKNIWEALKTATYETKVKIYDDRCAGCGFCRVEVHTDNLSKVYNHPDKALAKLKNMSGTWNVVRSCSYPGNVIRHNDKLVYPTLTEIISNTCMLWDNKNIPSEEDDMFIEVTEYSKFELPIIIQEFLSGQELPESRRSGEGMSVQDVPQSKSS